MRSPRASACPSTVTLHDASSTELDWTDAAAGYIVQNDGLSSLHSLSNYHDLSGPQPPLEVSLSGIGGEIGRSGTGALTPAGSNVPLLRRSLAAQRWLLRTKSRDAGGLMTEDATNALNGYLDEFIHTRLSEGWKMREIQEAFYTFERVGRWGATGVRLGAPRRDVFSPFCSRAFIDYCFAVTPGERLVESVHYDILSALSPELRDHRFDGPYPAQHPRLASAMATRKLLGAVVERVGINQRQNAGAPSQGQTPPSSFQQQWLEARLDLLRELFSDSDSDLWNYISRSRIHALLDAGESERASNLAGLLRAATIFWRFHGPAHTAVQAPPRVRPITGRRSRSGAVSTGATGAGSH